MATPLGITFSTDEQVGAQDDVTYIGKMAESLIVEWLRLNLHTKYKISELKKENVQVLNSSAIASGYAGRDPQGGFAMEALRFYWNRYKTQTKILLCFLRKENGKRIMLKLRRKREMKKVENQKTMKSDYVQWSGKKNENDLEEVVGDLN